MVIDYFTEQPAIAVQGPPVGANAVAGFSSDFGPNEYVVNYSAGTDFAPMPQWMSSLPMSLRNVALEIHTGRMYTFLGSMSVVYIFIVGMGHTLVFVDRLENTRADKEERGISRRYRGLKTPLINLSVFYLCSALFLAFKCNN